MKKEAKKDSEIRLQGICFQWHWNNYPDERKRLFMIHNTPRNKIDGSKMKAAGMVAGVSDLIYLRVNEAPVFIEMKIGNEKQSKEQIEFHEIAKTTGSPYHVINSFEDFKILINNLQNGSK